MADSPIHLEQAKHNEKFAIGLGRRLVRKDWFVTVAFYSALHYVEEGLFGVPLVRHSEQTKPRNRSFHSWRLECVQTYFPQAFDSYKKLKDLCITVRYLTGGGQPTLTVTAQEYLAQLFPNNQNFKQLIKQYLSDVKTGVGIQ